MTTRSSRAAIDPSRRVGRGAALFVLGVLTAALGFGLYVSVEKRVVIPQCRAYGEPRRLSLIRGDSFGYRQASSTRCIFESASHAEQDVLFGGIGSFQTDLLASLALDFEITCPGVAPARAPAGGVARGLAAASRENTMKPSILIGSLVALLLVACASGPAILTPPAPSNAPTKAAATAEPTLAATVAPTDAPLATEPAGQPGDARAAIGAALEALDRNGPYRMGIFAASDPEGPVFLEVVPPDRSHYMASVDGIRVEVITIGNTAYVLDPDGSWQVNTSTDSGSDAALIDPASLAALTDIQVLPPETLDGTATLVYSFIDPATPDVKVTLWVSVAEGRPVQMKTTSADDSVLYAIAYDDSITVEAPTP